MLWIIFLNYLCFFSLALLFSPFEKHLPVLYLFYLWPISTFLSCFDF